MIRFVCFCTNHHNFRPKRKSALIPISFKHYYVVLLDLCDKVSPSDFKGIVLHASFWGPSLGYISRAQCSGLASVLSKWNEHWFMCLEVWEESECLCLDREHMLHLLMGQRKCDLHAFFICRESEWARKRDKKIWKSTWQSSQHCPWAHTASPLRVQVVALQQGFIHS